ncbi:MAG: hypothetical protein K5876_00875 [Ruminiclostridium sp.]|nr:hypothetical protein [Ruminiclostridium sp.]
MYPVSSDYLSAVRDRVRTDMIGGSVTLNDGTVIPLTDSVLVKDTMKFTRELCRGSYRIGTFSLACLQFSIFLDDALGLDLNGAYAEPEYGLFVNGDWETVPLGRFLIDPVLSIRRKDILSIVAYDEGVLFDIGISDTLRSTSAAPPALIAAACAECGVSTDITAQTILPFPNSSLTVCAESSQIQTCRDLVMWCAALMCCYAAIDRDSKLVLIPAKYAVEPDDSTVIITDRAVRADERKSITVTDTRAYIKYLTAYAENDVVNYTSSYVSPDVQASPAAYVLEKNPLLEGKSASECNTANTAWLAYIDSFKQRGVKAVLFGDPAIDTGDTIVFRGGDVDQRTGIIGVVTGIEWRYRGANTIECLAAECVGRLTGQSSALVSSNVRKQSSKRIDCASGGSGGVGEDIGNHSERFNDYDDNTATGNHSYLHIEGKNNTAVWGYAAHIEGQSNTANNCNSSSIGGVSNTVTSDYAGDISGNNNQVSGSSCSTVKGCYNTVTNSSRDFVTGQHNTLNDADSDLVGGESNNVSGDYDTVSGYGNTVPGHYNTVSGSSNVVSGNQNTVGGSGNQVSGARNSVCGQNNSASYNDSMTCGDHNTNNAQFSMMCGRYGSAQSSLDHVLVVGNGSSGNLENSFYVKLDGSVYAANGYHAIGADYAEFFEWADGNPDGEDRRGLLVKLVGEKIAAAHGDEILGAVSARPSVIGNACEEHWHGKYKLDLFGDYVPDGNGDRQLSADYDPEREYIPRSKRREWAPVGMVGRLIIRDNGKCEPGGFVSARQGIGVPTYEETKVCCLKRLDDTHIEVLIR